MLHHLENPNTDYNAMREVVKKEVLKLLHAGIIYGVPHSESVSLVQVVPKKGSMTIV